MASSSSEVFARINGLTFRELWPVAKALAGGSLGYDPMKIGGKGNFAERARNSAVAYAQTHGGWDAVMALIDATLAGEVSDHQEGALAGDGQESGSAAQRQAKGKSESKSKDGKPGEGEGKQGQKAEPETAADKLAEHLREIMADMLPQGPSEDEMEAKVQEAVEKALKERAAVYTVKVQMPDKREVTDDEKPRHKAFPEVLTAVSAGLNVLLVGPAGCGKTHMGEQVHNCLFPGVPFRFSGAVASEYKLLGFTDAQGRPVRTEYREAYETGGVFLWDEIDASAPQAMLSFNAGLANGYQDFPDAIIKRHADFRAIASANTYGNGADRQYVGRNQLDAASLDRFYLIEMDHDEDLERLLFGDVEWTKYVQAARKAMKTLGTRHVVSMRAIDQGRRMIGTDIPREKVEKAVLWKHLPDHEIAKIKSAMGR